jgi:hypothetical protein
MSEESEETEVANQTETEGETEEEEVKATGEAVKKEEGTEEDEEALAEWEEEEGMMMEEVEEQETRKQGGRLAQEQSVREWERIGCAHLVRGGCRPDWLTGPPPTPRDYTRRERYAPGPSHDAMMKVLGEEQMQR